MPPDLSDPLSLGLDALARMLLDAIASSNWALLVAVLLMCVVAVARKYASPYVPFLRTDLGGILSVFLLSACGAAVTALKAGAPMSMGLFVDVVKMAFMAAGGFTVVKKFLAPLVVKNLPKLLAMFASKEPK